MTTIGGNGQLRSIVERILRLKEQQGCIAADVREVYAEAKSEGYDKTALGDLVTHLRRFAKDHDKAETRDQLFGDYLLAFEASHTHAREAAGTSHGEPA